MSFCFGISAFSSPDFANEIFSSTRLICQPRYIEVSNKHLSQPFEVSKPTCCANETSSLWLLKNNRVAASFNGRLSYAVSSQLAISFLYKMLNMRILMFRGEKYLMVPIKLSTKSLYSSAGASSRAFQTLL